jgi:hypothetical protein
VKSARNQEIPGPLYPDRCLECPEILQETYGACASLRCTKCVSAEIVNRPPLGSSNGCDEDNVFGASGTIRRDAA